MRRTALAALVVTLAGVAMGQDPAPAPRPVGTMLLDSLPAQADVVVAAPDFPALLSSLGRAGLGDAAAWQTAFEAQLREFGAGAPGSERLVTGGRALLDAADGEVVFASLGLKLPDGDAPKVRATLFAMRSTRDAKALGAAFRDLADGGLRLRYDGIARAEEIGGRPVAALPGATGTLYVTIQDGLLVASDHPLALGLFFRGIEREQGPAPANRPPVAQLKLALRHGRDAAAWEGWIWGEAESVSWNATPQTAVTPFVARPAASRTGVFIVGREEVADLPLFPSAVTPPDPAKAQRVAFVGIDGDKLCEGLGDSLPGAATEEQAKQFRDGAIGGGAWRLGWLGGMFRGTLAAPFPGIAPASLRAPFESASKSAGDTAGDFVAWKAGKDAGHLNGPIGHGPATFLALRCLHDISLGIAPGDAATTRVVRKAHQDAPLPPPTEPQHK